MANFTGRFEAEPLISLAFGSIVAGYTAIGEAFKEPASMLLIQNFTDKDLMISTNGIEDHFPIKAGASLIFDIGSNRTVKRDLFRPERTIYYVKRIGTPTSGSIYVTSFHG